MDVNPARSRRGLLRGSGVACGLVVSVGLLAACSQTDPETGATESEGGSTLDSIKEAGSVPVGFANEEPYAYRDGGELVGEAPAIHGEVFSRIGDISLDGKLFEFNALIPALNAGRVDVVTAGMFITPERCEQAAFSDPVYVVPTAFLVQEGNPKNLTDYQSIIDSGATLAVLSGAVEVDQAKSAGVPDEQLQIVSDQQSGLDAVKSGRADALSLTSISVRSLAEGASGVEVAEPFTPVIDGEEQIGAGAAVFRQGDDELREAFNEQLDAIMEEEGAWLSLVEDYGFTKDEKPPEDLTTEELCKG
ncbi:MAG TPA: ectoine/hydroxyectoine ABC transporter substrate-binding protein EhuB [Nocardioidaceae bacterium]|nr:ectoine/hydroxyectoine ABC transporter substrate-binding protein EhuB [Nocardioidaceae bacterium]